MLTQVLLNIQRLLILLMTEQAKGKITFVYCIPIAKLETKLLMSLDLSKNKTKQEQTPPQTTIHKGIDIHIYI